MVYIRMFRNRATVLTSNDTAALPPAPTVPISPINIPVAVPATTSVVTPSPVVIEPKPAEGAFAGFKKLWSGFQDPQGEELTPVAITPAPAKVLAPTPAVIQSMSPESSSASSPNSVPSSSPASGNMEGIKPYEPPNLLNSFQQLLN